MAQDTKIATILISTLYVLALATPLASGDNGISPPLAPNNHHSPTEFTSYSTATIPNGLQHQHPKTTVSQNSTTLPVTTPQQVTPLVLSGSSSAAGLPPHDAQSSAELSAPPIAVSTQYSNGGAIGATSTQVSITTQMQENGGGDSIQEPMLVDHEIIGSAGPDKREIEGIQKALDWLKEKRAPDYGWGNDTHMVILSKELSGARDLSDADGHLQVIQDLEDTLSVKEMEIEILSMLDRHHTLPKPVNLDKLARYVLALGSLCKDPKRFHGHDLVATLQHHEPAQDIEFALTTLAACSSAAHVRKKQIRRLLDTSGVTDQSVDTIAMVILALRCIVTDHRHRQLQHFVRRTAQGLASMQDLHGGFGSLRSTALAMQALQDLERDPAGSWNRTAASKWILSRQREDGGWAEEPLQDGQDPSIGVGLTADIILALGWKGIGAVRALQCDHVIRESSDMFSENGEPKLAVPYGLTSSAEESDPKNVSYTYTLWVGSNVTESFFLSLVSPKNTSFFRAMTQAADIDERFAFDAREWPNGHYVHTLAGKQEEPRGYNYWLLYRLPELPDPSNPPGNHLIAPVGVDELMVEDGEHYLYWYKKL